MFSFRSYDAFDIGMKNIDMEGTTSVFSKRSKKKDRISSTYLNDSDLWPSICSSNVLYYKAINPLSATGRYSGPRISTHSSGHRS